MWPGILAEAGEQSLLLGRLQAARLPPAEGCLMVEADLVVAMIEDFPSEGVMLVNALYRGERRHGVLSDTGRAAILEAFAELEEHGEEDR
jgi:hypothetical protein